jgi:hypothetical protein
MPVSTRSVLGFVALNPNSKRDGDSVEVGNGTTHLRSQEQLGPPTKVGVGVLGGMQHLESQTIPVQ